MSAVAFHLEQRSHSIHFAVTLLTLLLHIWLSLAASVVFIHQSAGLRWEAAALVVNESRSFLNVSWSHEGSSNFSVSCVALTYRVAKRRNGGSKMLIKNRIDSSRLIPINPANTYELLLEGCSDSKCKACSAPIARNFSVKSTDPHVFGNVSIVHWNITQLNHTVYNITWSVSLSDEIESENGTRQPPCWLFRKSHSPKATLNATVWHRLYTRALLHAYREAIIDPLKRYLFETAPCVDVHCKSCSVFASMQFASWSNEQRQSAATADTDVLRVSNLARIDNRTIAVFWQSEKQISCVSWTVQLADKVNGRNASQLAWNKARSNPIRVDQLNPSRQYSLELRSCFDFKCQECASQSIRLNLSALATFNFSPNRSEAAANQSVLELDAETNDETQSGFDYSLASPIVSSVELLQSGNSCSLVVVLHEKAMDVVRDLLSGNASYQVRFGITKRNVKLSDLKQLVVFTQANLTGPFNCSKRHDFSKYVLLHPTACFTATMDIADEYLAGIGNATSSVASRLRVVARTVKDNRYSNWSSPYGLQLPTAAIAAAGVDQELQATMPMVTTDITATSSRTDGESVRTGRKRTKQTTSRRDETIDADVTSTTPVSGEYSLDLGLSSAATEVPPGESLGRQVDESGWLVWSIGAILLFG